MRYRALLAAFFALCLGVLTACSEAPSATSEIPLTYDQIRNTGLANSCPQVDETRRGQIPIEDGTTYKLVDLCLEPTSFFVKQESANKRKEAEFVSGKSLTRYTTSIEQVSGDINLQEDGSLVFDEKLGMDFQPITVLLPGGDQIPFLFTIKGLEARSQAGLNAITTSTDFEGSFRVPSYRTSNFLDPKARGLTTGYDNAVALPARADANDLARENVKAFDVGSGTISLQISKVDSNTGEIGGTFISEQPSDTDMGTAAADDVRLQGVFYGRIETEFDA
ncbi:photosystem II manganese-stabilizing polypeptide [cf. Phormidesmis sp. LEGE 11477]|uniref:photosystem II manganese-stabilizing polypeptide n=1 Tax=cf. Phormidesmis sp. LEGE 11477 TaxID=1828680 RepID=UPI001882117D|nr:photosystem II manganese-stabilizing polypeptide [cf. Phormidesmis sp. LEGE 11477]MBE9061995.1 photosystem II manganese-stabilizing polypeptide [cf. Phormidesmis sp. LEGE 11477]